MLTVRSEVAPKVPSLLLFNVHSLALPSLVAFSVSAFFTLKVCLRASSAVTFSVAVDAAVEACVATLFALLAVVCAATAFESAVDAAVDATVALLSAVDAKVFNSVAT